MPEDAEGRETYGNAPGWSDKQTEQAPDKGVKGASPAPDVDAAPSAEVSQEETPSEAPVTEQAPPTPSQPAADDVPFHQHPRWIERQKELEETRKQRDDALRLAQQVVERTPPVQTQPQADPWTPYVSHQDPETARFWTSMRDLVRHERQQGRQDAVQDLQPVIQAGMEKLAMIDLRDFRKDNPEISPGSQEEQQIVSYMEGRVDGMRHPLESAKRNVLFNRLNSEVKSYKTKQAAIPQKRAAATSESSSGIPSTAGLPGKPRTSNDVASDILDKGGTMRDVAKAIFG